MAKLNCRYKNTTDNFQIFIFKDLERVLYPQVAIEFYAQSEDYIVIKDGFVTSSYADNISCQKLINVNQAETPETVVMQIT